MTPFDKLVEFILNQSWDFSFWGIIKIFLIIGLLIYLAFAVIIVRQVGLMTRTLNGHLEIPLKLVAVIHLIVALVVLFLTIVIL